MPCRKKARPRVEIRLAFQFVSPFFFRCSLISHKGFSTHFILFVTSEYTEKLRNGFNQMWNLTLNVVVNIQCLETSGNCSLISAIISCAFCVVCVCLQGSHFTPMFLQQSLFQSTGLTWLTIC